MTDIYEIAPHELQTPATVHSVSDAADFAAALCASEGLAPQEAAIRTLATVEFDKHSLSALAAVGLRVLVNSRLHHQREAAWKLERDALRALPRQRVGAPEDPRPTTLERRAQLYARVRGALSVLYMGSDGEMRTLLDFTREDHAHRLHEVTNIARGWKRAARFHNDAMVSLKAAGVTSIKELPGEEQARLAGLLT